MAKNGGPGGGSKKGAKLSRLGELLNTQKNVHFLSPRGDPPRGGVPGCQSAPNSGPLLGGSFGKYNVQVVRRAAHSGLPGPRFRVRFSAHFGARAPGRPGGGIFRNFRISGISPRPGPGPGPPSRGGCRGGVAWDRIWQGALGPIITPPQARLLLSQFALATVMSPKHSIAVAT